MHVIAVHNITDAERFGAAVGPAIEKIPSSMTLHGMFPSEDGARAVRAWEAGSIGDVRSFVDSVTGDLNRDEYFRVADAQAIGLPHATATTALKQRSAGPAGSLTTTARAYRRSATTLPWVWVLFDWDESGWQNFVSDPEVPAILQEAGHKG